MAYVYLHIYVYKHIYIYMYIHIHVHIYIYIYTTMRRKAKTTCNGQAQVKRPATKGYDDMKHQDDLQWPGSGQASSYKRL